MKEFKRFHILIKETSFKKLFIIWILIVFCFGLVYYFMTGYTDNHLIYRGAPLGTDMTGFLDSIYFSFITSTSLGYGDVAPMGFTKVLAIIEVLFGLFMSGAIIAKIVSSKEETILEEIYNITFFQKIDRLRTNLYYDRVNASSYFKKKKPLSADAEILYLNLESHMLDLKDFLVRYQKKNEYLKELDGYTKKLIFKSIELVLERYTLLKLYLDKHKLSKGFCEQYSKNIKITTDKIIEILGSDDRVLEEGSKKIRTLVKKI